MDEEAAFIPPGSSDLSPSIGECVGKEKAPVLGEFGGLPRMRGVGVGDKAAPSRLLAEPPKIEASDWKNVGICLQIGEATSVWTWTALVVTRNSLQGGFPELILLEIRDSDLGRC